MNRPNRDKKLVDRKWYYDMKLQVPVYVVNIYHVIKDNAPHMVLAKVPNPGYKGRIYFEEMPINVNDLAEIVPKPIAVQNE